MGYVIYVSASDVRGFEESTLTRKTFGLGVHSSPLNLKSDS